MARKILKNDPLKIRHRNHSIYFYDQFTLVF